LLFPSSGTSKFKQITHVEKITSTTTPITVKSQHTDVVQVMKL
jgi:hypothetical protein